MTCLVYNCVNNDGTGYCQKQSYITINDEGECDDCPEVPIADSSKAK
jgi:hypothetical protein